MQAEQIIRLLEENIEEQKEKYNIRKGQREQLLADKKEREEKINSLDEDLDVYEQTRILLQQTAEYAREQAKAQIESLVTNALQYVFGPQFSFEIEIEEKRSRPYAEFYVVSSYEDRSFKNKPQEARGGGIVDVVSLALRIAILESYGATKIAGPLILDEPAKHVSEDYITNVAQFLKAINKRFARQIIVVTHKNHLSEIADRSFQVDLTAGISEVTSNFQS
ncbi:ATP-binding protein [Fuchsiella alkaliacetigena]|uniref:ATP-binding protein n=1 Tax=Fuchsiella alkaliacetigena TaxID=957042 RepID=UPI00200A80DC|nr:ATP-binding protein [Fuchsiella alkaliacetigena]MCK8824258.1 ATP-binding protein [Fuchsiella alkaliacetigena]